MSTFSRVTQRNAQTNSEQAMRETLSPQCRSLGLRASSQLRGSRDALVSGLGGYAPKPYALEPKL